MLRQAWFMRFHIPTSVRKKLRGSWLAKLYSQSDRWMITLSRGRFGSRLRLGGDLPDAPVLVVETTGRTSGKRRATPIMYLERADGYVVIASNAGHSQHPAWWLNLQKTPQADVLVGGQRVPVVAHELAGEERRAAWSAFLAMYPGLSDYQRDTERVFPVVCLRRA
jgi:deazaflavin-dependent oxidoreductase (nitroreductase family)